MSPLEIPGTSINIPYPLGKEKCPSCKRDYDERKVRKNGEVTTYHCPWCNCKLDDPPAKPKEQAQEKKESEEKK